MTSGSRQVTDLNGARHVLTRQLGQGGQGAVFEVRGGRLAAKIIFDSSSSRREQLRNQLTAVKRLPLADLEIARPLEMLREPVLGYLMELLTGMQPLSTLCNPPKTTASVAAWYFQTGGLRRRLELLARAADVLSSLHGKGLVYSDPSPHNIFISETSDATEVRFIDSDNIHYASSAGIPTVFTSGYGAPELIRGASGVNSLTDAHAFAVICFQVLSLAHPFIGDAVANGPPEGEEEAFLGARPFVDDPVDNSNRCTIGIPRSFTLSARLAEISQRAFGTGLNEPLQRPGVSEWAERLHAASDATVLCQKCHGTYYMNAKQCPWCDAPRLGFVIAEFQLWDPALGEGSELISRPSGDRRKPVIVAALALTDGESRIITRRLATGQVGPDGQRPMIELKFDGERVTLQALDGVSYRLTSPTGARASSVGPKPSSILLKPDEASWRLHLGSPDTFHRIVSFSARKGGTK